MASNNRGAVLEDLRLAEQLIRQLMHLNASFRRPGDRMSTLSNILNAAGRFTNGGSVLYSQNWWTQVGANFDDDDSEFALLSIEAILGSDVDVGTYARLSVICNILTAAGFPTSLPQDLPAAAAAVAVPPGEDEEEAGATRGRDVGEDIDRLVANLDLVEGRVWCLERELDGLSTTVDWALAALPSRVSPTPSRPRRESNDEARVTFPSSTPTRSAPSRPPPPVLTHSRPASETGARSRVLSPRPGDGSVRVGFSAMPVWDREDATSPPPQRPPRRNDEGKRNNVSNFV